MEVNINKNRNKVMNIIPEKRLMEKRRDSISNESVNNKFCLVEMKEWNVE